MLKILPFQPTDQPATKALILDGLVEHLRTGVNAPCYKYKAR